MYAYMYIIHVHVDGSTLFKVLLHFETDQKVRSNREATTVVDFLHAEGGGRVIVCCVVTNSPTHVHSLQHTPESDMTQVSFVM